VHIDDQGIDAQVARGSLCDTGHCSNILDDVITNRAGGITDRFLGLDEVHVAKRHSCLHHNGACVKHNRHIRGIDQNLQRF
jgi:hypothetical protein